MEFSGLFSNEFNWVGHTDVWPTKDSNWPEKRERLFEKYQQWGNAIAYQLYANYKVDGMESADYLHFSCIGLLESLDRFDPSYGVPFKAFARNRVKGEILNNIIKFSEKAQSNMVKNKLIKERVLIIQESISDGDDSATALTDTILDLAMGFLIEEHSYEQQSTKISGTEYDSLEINAIQEHIFSCFSDLSAIQNKVMTMHYRELKSFSVIGKELKLSPGRISQVHNESLKLLRRKLSW